MEQVEYLEESMLYKIVKPGMCEVSAIPVENLSEFKFFSNKIRNSLVQVVGFIRYDGANYQVITAVRVFIVPFGASSYIQNIFVLFKKLTINSVKPC